MFMAAGFLAYLALTKCFGYVIVVALVSCLCCAWQRAAHLKATNAVYALT
jgi:hypothetical protein